MTTIRARLLLWLLSAVVAAGLSGAFTLYENARDGLDQVFDEQLQQTALSLRGQTVVAAVERLVRDPEHDSVLLATEETGFLWYRGAPVNYDPGRPDGLPRSQDVRYVKETTGLYAVTREVVLRQGCRVGRNPLFHLVPRLEALDIDTLEDLHIAERLFEERP